MVKISVASVRSGARGEYIGRGSYGKVGSPLGNPFVVGRDGARGECVKLYEPWLNAKLDRGDQAIVAEMMRLANIARAQGDLTLVCWCAPAACHGDVIARVLRERFGVDATS